MITIKTLTAKMIVGASKPAHFKIGAEGIMWWEGTPVSHVYIKLEVLPCLFIVFQAVGSGTEFCGVEYFLDHNTPMYEKQIEVPIELYDKIIIKAVSLLKMKYPIKHLVGLFYKRFIQYTFKKIVKNPFADGQSEVCVQAMCALVDAAEIIRKAEDPQDMGMFEALEMLKAMPGKVILCKI
jgi:hypothetical protein